MLKTAQTLALWSALALSQAAWATPTCWTFAEGGNGHCYELAQLPGPDVSWDAASTAAQSTTYGDVTGHLATVSSAAEDAMLLSLLTAHPEARFAWLGGHQLSPLVLPDQGWAWVTGEPWDYTHWAPGEPNDYVGVAESYLAMWGVDTGREPGAWNDEGYYVVDGWYLVEYDTPPGPCQVTLFVNGSAQGAKTGRSWVDAYTDLQAALDEAALIDCGPVQIWVAKGVYRPSKAVLPNDRRTAAFQMADQLAIYGGFTGGETSLTQRKPFENLTILNGDLDDDDPPWLVLPNSWESNHVGANSYWVVEAQGVDTSAVLDGFVLENGDKISDGGSGGAYTGGFGGGLMVNNSSPTVANCIFRRNVGAGIGIRPNSNPAIVNCRFLGNFPCGIEAYGSAPVIVNCAITGHYYAVFLDYSYPNIKHCTITGNDTAIGLDGGATADLANCIVWGNESLGNVSASVMPARNSLIQWFDEPYPGEGNIDADPLFVDALGADGQYGTLDDDLRLQAPSPCTDSGDNAAVPSRDSADLDGDGIFAEELPLDLNLKARRVDNPVRSDTGLGTSPVVDMGAYEYHPDCNHNGVDDQEDIANGTSQDCNGNGVPDECDVASEGLVWSAPTSVTTGPEPFSIAAGDLNADGRTDLVVGYFGTFNGSRYVGGGVTVLINQGNRAFASANYPAGDRPESIAIADFNEDGKPDLATADADSQSLSLLAQQPTGWFYRVANIHVEARPQAIAAGNLDGLYRPEFVVGHSNGLTVFAYEDGEGYRAIGHYLSGVWVNSVTLADLDRNGTLDIVTASQSATSVHVLFGRGDRTFGEPVQYIQGVDEAQHVTAADIDGDGDLDLVVSDQGLNAIMVMLNTGSGAFDLPQTYEFGDSVSPRATAAADFDGDGDLDLAVADIITPSLLVLRNDGGGHFGSVQAVVTQVAQWFAVQADLDGDGDADVAVVGPPGEGRVLWNETKSATSHDCNGNRVPDECEPDRDRDGIPDACDPLTLLYVDTDATGSNDGSSWANAFTDLQSALAVAYNPGGSTITHIWVAEGVYRPTWLADWADPPDPRTATFELPNNTAVYGGFASGETSLSQRDPAAHETILSGDLNGNDVMPGDPSELWRDTSRDDNSYHVVTVSGVDPTTVLDGFTIIGGKANKLAGGTWMGGGLYNIEGSPTISRCLFLWNCAEQGGGIFNTHTSHPRLISCSFRGNRANDCGGGMYDREADADLVNCEFMGNRAEDWAGGGVYNYSGKLTLTNCTVTGNWASDGGSGICNTADSSIAITNSIIRGNIRDDIILGRTVAITYSLMPHGWDDEGDIDADPLFVDADGPDSMFGTRDDNVSLRPDSPCINAGRNVALPLDIADLDQDGDRAEPTPHDLAGRARIAGAIVDIGAYEYYSDCNHNNVDDHEDIANGSSRDDNGNGIPDECELSCIAQRVLPPGYVPGLTLTSGIEVKPGAGVAVYAIEDTPPSGWTVGAINEGGVFDTATGKVKWGPFLDNQARTLTYEATPPAGAHGNQCFGPGVISMDGERAEICGNACVEPCFDHPADSNHDRRLVVDEATAYAAAWKHGSTWPTPPNPIPIGFMTRAGALWKYGETYCCDPSQAPPMLWINCSPAAPLAQTPSEAVAGASATRTVTAGAGFFTVTIKATPAGAAAYAIEEAPPVGPGWIVSEIIDDGQFDPAANRVRWGPFHDGQDRMLTYRLTPPNGSGSGVFAGVLSTDGTDQAVAGAQTIIMLPADLDRDWDVDLDDAKALERCVTGPAVPLEGMDCKKADLDCDGDVDQSDFGLLQRCYSGANVPADANCAN